MLFSRRLLCLTLAVAWISIGSPLFSQATETSQFRGPSSADSGDGLPEGSFGLEVAWTRDLGSGYSNIWIDGDTAVTMLTSGDVDVVAAFGSASGEEIWRQRLGGRYYASPLTAAGRVYTWNTEGETKVLAAADEFAELATNKLAAPIRATPAIACGALFIRTTEALYRIEALTP